MQARQGLVRFSRKLPTALIFTTCVQYLHRFLPNKQGAKAAAKAEGLDAAMAAAGLEFGISIPTAPPRVSSPGAANRNPRAPLGDISNLDAEGVGRAASMDGGGADATLETGLSKLEQGKVGESGVVRERGGRGDTGKSGRPFGREPDGPGRGTGGAGRGRGGGGGIGGRGGPASPIKTNSPEAGMKGPASGPAAGPAKTRGPVSRTSTGPQGGGDGSGDASPPAASAARHGFSGRAAREDSERSRDDGGQRMPNRGSREGGGIGATGSSIDPGGAGAVGQRGDGVGVGTRNVASGGDGQPSKREGGGGKVGWGGGGRKRGPWSAQKRQGAAGTVEGRVENGKPSVIDPKASVDEIISSMGLNRDITLQGLGGGSEKLGLSPGDRSRNSNSGGKDGTLEEGQKGWGIGKGFQRLFRGKTKGQPGEK